MKKLIIILSTLISFSSHAEWSVSITADEMTDANIGVLQATSEKGVNWLGLPFVAKVRCKSNNYSSLEIYINWREFISTGDPDRIDFRFDKNSVQSILSSPSTDGKATFIRFDDDIEKILSLMKSKNIMRVRTTNFNGVKTQVGTFSLNNFKTSYAEACSWWEDDKIKKSEEERLYKLNYEKNKVKRKKEQAKNNKSYAKKQYNATMQQCPEDYKEHLALEKKYGRPQMWRGCP